MKKVLASLAAGALALTCVIMPVHAANGINADEQRLLDYVDKGIVVNGDTYRYAKGSKDYEALKDLLAQSGMDLTTAEVDTIKDNAKEIGAFISDNYDEKMSEDIVNELIAMVKPTMDIFGLKVSYNAVTDELIILDSAGNEVTRVPNVVFEPTTDPEITPTPKPVDQAIKSDPKKLENTGENFTSTYVIMGGLGVVLLGAGLLARKKNAENA